MPTPEQLASIADRDPVAAARRVDARERAEAQIATRLSDLAEAAIMNLYLHALRHGGRMDATDADAERLRGLRAWYNAIATGGGDQEVIPGGFGEPLRTAFTRAAAAAATSQAPIRAGGPKAEAAQEEPQLGQTML
jgi:hypothetical protein